MILPAVNSINDDVLMLWIMHQLAEHFKDHAILRGGMQLMLYSSERATNDLDYVFVPYKSKKEISAKLNEIFSLIPHAKISKELHSTTGIFRISVGKANVQIDFTVSMDTPSTPLSTELLARKLNQFPRIIRVMEPRAAFAHKIAAWNERRLMRDLYDIYFWYALNHTRPDFGILSARLAKVNSQLPHIKSRKKMTWDDFIVEFTSEIDSLNESKFLQGLRSIIPEDTLNGIFPIFLAKLRMLASELKAGRP